MSESDNEAQIDAKIKETDRSIAELQKAKQELVNAKRALKSGKTETAPSSPPLPRLDDKALEKVMNMLEWSSYKKKDGEWAFLRKRDGALMEDLIPAVEFIDQLRKGRHIIVGKYEYSASEDKFLSRYIAGTS